MWAPFGGDAFVSGPRGGETEPKHQPTSAHDLLLPLGLLLRPTERR